MPCTGPGMPTDKEIDTVTEEVMAFLKEKHHVHSMPKEYQINREKDKVALREAIKVILENRNCEEF